MLPEPYRGVVARALEKDPAKRFASVGEMLAALPAAANAGPPSLAVSRREPPVSTPPPIHPSRPSHPSSASPIPAEVVDEEPIFRAIVHAWGRCRRFWATLDMTAKILLAILVVVALHPVLGLVAALAVVLLPLYFIYRLVRMVVLAIIGKPAAPVPDAPAKPTSVASPPPVERPAPRWIVKSPRERTAELLASLLGSALATAAVCVAMVLLAARRGLTPRPEECAWLALTSVAGAWTVLAAGKFWEGSDGEPMLRRFLLMVVGLGLGAAAWGVADGLHAALPPSPGLPVAREFGDLAPASFYDAGRPLLMAYMACFGTLFALVRWWRQVDPRRQKRLSLWTVIVSALTGGIVAAVWHFPQPWLPMVAASMSVAVQLASPWALRRERKGAKT